jgi:predicted chitinase
LRQFCKNLLGKIDKAEEERSKIFGQILGRAGEHEDLLYQQMHTLYHQWQILGAIDGKRVNLEMGGKPLTPVLANELQKTYGETVEKSDADNDVSCGRQTTSVAAASGFRYDYPLQAIGSGNKSKGINVADSIINLDALYNAKANTTVLNIFQQLCSKNNFMFFPIAGNARYNKISDIFKPSGFFGPKIGNFFQVLFQPTPESRTLGASKPKEAQSLTQNLDQFQVEAFPVSFGDPTNKIIKSVVVSTDENKVTAESIINLQRIVDNENQNRTVTTDCSLLSVFEGRSYKAKLETLGNAQVSPMQFFFLKNHTIFTGLYQIIKVDHNITPNDMTTEFEGIKMRYTGAEYGGIHPITIQDYAKAADASKEAPGEEGDPADLTKSKAATNAALEAARASSATSSNGGGSGGGSGGGAGAGGGNYQVTGTDAGAKTVQDKFINNSTRKPIMDKFIQACIDDGWSNVAIAAASGVISKEGAFKMSNENMNYSKERMPEVFSTYSKTGKKVKKGTGAQYYNKRAESHNKQASRVGNWVYGQSPGDGKVYGAREKAYGNKDPKDGYKYRGRGLNQVTFRGSYKEKGNQIGVDLEKFPEKMLEVANAVKVTVAFFNAGRNSSQFGPKGNRVDKKTAYGVVGKDTFEASSREDAIKNAVFTYYHYNTGRGKTVSYVKNLLAPSDSLGGMQKAQARTPAFLEYIQKQFTNPNGDGIKIV